MGKQINYVITINYLKTCLFAFNIAYWMFGLTLLLIAVWAEFDLHRYMELSSDFSGTATHLTIGISCLIIIVTSFAFSCIVKGQTVMLYIYTAFLSCILIMNAGVGLSMMCFWHTFGEGLHNGLTQTIMANDPHKANLDFAQKNFHCCGVSNYSDWTTLSPQKVIPISCCIDPNNCVTANYSDVYQCGCYDVVTTYVNEYLGVFIAMSISTALIPNIGILMACYLAHFVEKAKHDNGN